jgi:hypothetical protein
MGGTRGRGQEDKGTRGQEDKGTRGEGQWDLVWVQDIFNFTSVIPVTEENKFGIRFTESTKIIIFQETNGDGKLHKFK